MRSAAIRLLLLTVAGLLVGPTTAIAAFSPTGSMAAARTQPTATALPGGATTATVLAAGGFDATGTPLTSAERYDVGAGTWTPTTAMNAAHGGHHAILLPSGNVFVVGGLSTLRGGIIPSTGTEQYDPVKDAWNQTAAQTTARQQDAAVLGTFRGAQQVFVTGGQTAAAGVLTDVEVYSPVGNVWAGGPALQTARRNHAIVALPDGRLLVVGGFGAGGTPLATTEFYNPLTNVWTFGPTLATPRADHTLSLVDGTRVLAAGGVTTGGAATASAEVLDLSGGAGWQPGGPMAIARAGHRATVVRSGLVVMTGGANAGALGGLDSAESWTPANGWGGPYNLPGSTPIGGARLSHAAAAIPQSDEVLVFGGGTAAGGVAGTASLTAARWTPDKPIIVPPTTPPTTPLAEPPPAVPVQGRSLVASAVTGNVFVRIGKTDEYRELKPGEAVPVGTVLDTTDGRVRLLAAVGGGTQTAWFWGGTFTVLQPAGPSGYVEIRLFGKPVCKKGSSKATRLVKRKTKPKVWGDGKGKFRTKGANSSASVSGTKWLVEERCTGTFTKVERGRVNVRDFPKHKTVIVRAGKNYLARPPRR